MPAKKNLPLDVAREGLETREDRALAKIAEERKRTLVRSAALRHDEVWRASHVPPQGSHSKKRRGSV